MLNLRVTEISHILSLNWQSRLKDIVIVKYKKMISKREMDVTEYVSKYT